MQQQKSVETLIRASDTTEGKQVKKIVDDIALLPEYVMGMQETTSSSQWCQSVFTSPILEQYDPVWESQHFKDDRLAKAATASYLQRSANAKMHQDWAGKVTGWRRDNFDKEHGHHKCQSMLVVATAEILSGQGGSFLGEACWCTNKQRREVAALLPSLDLCCGDGQAAAQFLTFWNT